MVNIIFGGANVSDQDTFNTPEIRAQILDVLLADDVTNIDTARLYPNSEVAIGALEKRARFSIDTKLEGGFIPGSVTKENVVQSAQESLKRVDIKQFDILYIHAPDTSTPFEETLAGINQAHQNGIFRRFGLSNFTPEQVQQVYDIASSNGYILPTVYQGHYSPVSRHYEKLLFPTLANLGIKFYAYSPLAGGFLTKTAADLDAGAGRFNPQFMGGFFSKLYDNATMRQALLKWNEIAEKEGVGRAELAYRWLAFNSPLARDEGNGVIFGASSVKQAGETAGYFKKGALSAEAVQGIEDVWKMVQEVAPLDFFSAMAS